MFTALSAFCVFLRDPHVRNERGLSQSAENAILLAGAVTIAGGDHRGDHRSSCRVASARVSRAVSRVDERGMTESVQIALIWPLLLLVTLGVIQAGIWIHGRQVALRAAVTAADVASGSAGSSGAARDLATKIARVGRPQLGRRRRRHLRHARCGWS